MPTPFPHHYEVHLHRTQTARAQIELAPRHPIAGGPPPQFDGVDSVWSPEHLLLSSIGLCLFTTFEALARRDSLDVAGWRAKVDGVIEKTQTGLNFTSFTVSVDLTVDSANVERARATLDRAKRHCIVSNALRVPVIVDANVVGADAAA